MNTQRVEGHTSTLKSCPFCGANAARVINTPAETWPYQIKCANCGALTDDCGTESIATEVWNQRPANIERLEKVNEALVRALEGAQQTIHENCCIHSGEMSRYHHPDCDDIRAALALAKEPA